MPDTSGTCIDVLKFGGSVLRDDDALRDVAQRIYAHVRAGSKVVAVTSAFQGRTDRILSGLDTDVDPGVAAPFLAAGEVESSLRLTLALGRIGVRARALHFTEIGLATTDSPLDADLLAVRPEAIRRALARVDVVVVPGFGGTGPDGSTTLLGRGGSDLTAIALAAALDATCTLVKDVDGIWNPADRKTWYRTLTFATADTLGAQVVQRKALEWARLQALPFRVEACRSRVGSIVGASFDTFHASSPVAARRPRVALLGLGVVGAGVYAQLVARSEALHVAGIAVRDRHRDRSADIPSPLDRSLLGTDARAIAARGDIVIEVMGGIDLPFRIAAESLARGAHVITANKALLAAHGDTLRALAQRHGATLACGASVGGAAPMIELVRRVRSRRPVQSFSAVLNGTCQWIGNELAHGEARFDDLVAEAVRRGYAESDPSRDLDGTDAADKLVVLCQEAFGRQPDQLSVAGLRSLTAADAARGVRLLATATRDDDGIRASVTLAPIADGSPLAALNRSGCWNGIVVHDVAGTTTSAFGRGAGRWPTSAAVIADLDDVLNVAAPAPSVRGALTARGGTACI